MKIIFVTREGYHLAGGRIRSYNFAKELARHGIETEVLSYADNLGAKDGIYESSMGFRQKLKYNFLAYKKLSAEKNAVIVLQRVNYHSFAPFLSCILGKNRLVLDMDDWEIREKPGYLFGIYPTSKAEYFTRRIISLSDFCIAGSSYLDNYMRQFKKEVYCIPSCVDTDLFQPVEGKKSNIIKFAWIGTLHRKDDVENVKFIIDCFEELKNTINNVFMEITGDGIYRREILSYVSNCCAKENINLNSWIHPDKMPFYLQDIDIGLFPLIQNTKFNLSKSPAKLFEYMAMGKAAVSSELGEAAAIIKDGTDGFLAKDKKSFIDRMRLLVKDAELRENIGQNARKKILQNYSLNIAGKKLHAIFTAKF